MIAKQGIVTCESFGYEHHVTFHVLCFQLHHLSFSPVIVVFMLMINMKINMLDSI